MIPVLGAPLLVAAKVVDMSDLAAFTAGAIENLKRNDMGPVDMANIVGMYKHKFGMTNLEIGKTLGKTLSWVGEHLLILDLPARHQKKIAIREIPYTVVRDMKGMDEAEMDAYVEKLEKGEVVRGGGKGKAKAKKKAKAAEVANGTGSISLTMREFRAMMENMAGVGKEAEAAAAGNKEYVCGYSGKVQEVALLMIKTINGKVKEKALANKIDAV